MKHYSTILLMLIALINTSYSQEVSNYHDIDVNAVLDNYQLANAVSSSYTMTLPVPGHGLVQFNVKSNNLLSAEMKQKNPSLYTFDIKAVAPYHYTGKMTIGEKQLYAVIQTERGLLSIEPSIIETGKYQAFYDDIAPDFQETSGHQHHAGCSDPAERDREGLIPTGTKLEKSESGFSRGDRIRSYRLVVIATGEFTAANGGTVASADLVITNSVNAMNLIYEKDLAVTLTLTNTEVYTNAATDPFTPDNASSASGLGTGDGRTNQAAEAVNADFAIGTYDIGHVFHTHDGLLETDINDDGWSGGGVAGLGVVCRELDWTLGDSDATFGPAKAAGWSGSFSNTGNGWIGLVTHEFGHMFSAPHTFNGTNTAPGNCTNNISSTSAYEIGSGTTIMSYNGLCQADNNIPASGTADNYFHAMSIEQMNSYITSAPGNSCGTDGPVMNAIPVVDTDPCSSTALTVPIGTPFTLTGQATDADGDALSYCWEQVDEDGAGTPTQGAIGAVAAANPLAPLFRSFPPSSDPSRSFPSLSDIKNGISSDFEVLSTVARTMNFALTVRDCNGGIACESRQVDVVDSGPLVVNNPCGAGLNAGDATALTWNTNGSDALCTNVDILMSIDGGCNFNYTLASGVAYSAGTSLITIPANIPNTTEARFQIICTDNPCATFFSMSASDCIITSSCTATSTDIAPTGTFTFPFGDAGLNLSCSNNLGSIITNITGSIEATDDSGNLIFIDCNGTCASSGGNPTNFDTYEFTPDATGAYMFTRVGASLILNIYDLPFSGSGCSNLLGSSGVQMICGMGVSTANPVNVTLTAGVTYGIAITSFTTGVPALPAAYTINFSGPGNIFDGVIPPAGFDYTYIAIDDATGNVTAQSATSDFTGLPAGCYTVYGVSYEGTINPDTWLDAPLSTALNNGDCLLQSNNSKTVKVTGTCTLSPGDLIVTEIMFNPSGAEPAGEWFEVFNTTAAPIDMNGLVLCDNNGSHTVGSSVIVPSMGYAILGDDSNTANNGGVNIDYQYTTLNFANGGDEINIKCADGTLIDGVDYSGFGLGANGASIQLDPTLVNTGGNTDNDTGTNWFTSTSGTGFGDGDFGTPGGMNALPVELLAFNVTISDEVVLLDWITVTELNNDYFEIQRSLDGAKFHSLGKVNGAGTTLERQQYQFTDLTPNKGENYYRLKQIDLDGSYDYSNIQHAAFGKEQLVSKVYPSPTNDILHVTVNQELNQLEILDITGRILLHKQYEEVLNAQVEVTEFPTGAYFLRIQTEETTKLVRFIKN